jgi:hypothetical protein
MACFINKVPSSISDHEGPRNIAPAAYPQATAVNPDSKTAHAGCMDADKVAEIVIEIGGNSKDNRPVPTSGSTFVDRKPVYARSGV